MYTASQRHEYTLLVSSYYVYLCTEQIFDSRPVMNNKIFMKKNLKEVDTSHLYASFGTFFFQICYLFQAQWDFKLSEEFEIDVIFLQKLQFYHFQTFFKDSLWTQKVPKKHKDVIF